MIGQAPSAKEQSPRKAFIRPTVLVVSILVGIAVQFSATWQMRESILKGRSDFEDEYAAGKIVASGMGSRLYDEPLQIRIQHEVLNNPTGPAHYFIHAPFEALLFAPISYFSFAHALWFWWALSVLLGYAALGLVLPLLSSVRDRSEMVLLGFALFVPFFYAQLQGQDTVLTLLLFAFCFWGLRRDRTWMAAIALALTTYKIPLALPMVAIIACASANRKKLLGAFLASCVVLLAISAAAIGWSGVLSYPVAVRHFGSGEGLYDARGMPNINGLVHWLLEGRLPPGKLSLITMALSILVLTLSAWIALRSSRKIETDTLRFSLAVVASLLVGFHEYAYDLTLLVLPLLLGWQWSTGLKADPLRRRLLLGLIGFLFFASAFSLMSPQIYACAIILFFIVILRELYLSSRREAVFPELREVDG